MAKYRKKPVIIDAIQLNWQNWSTVCDFVGSAAFESGIFVGGVFDEGVYYWGEDSNRIGPIAAKIQTLEGDHIANENDWIIRGIKGELYPCKPDIFEQTYELVED